MTGIQSLPHGTKAVWFGVASAVIYMLMINLTLSNLEVISGQRPFDMRPIGYSPDDAAALLQALGQEGRRFYLTRQIPLDTIYPALLALTLMSGFRWLATRRGGTKLLRVGLGLSVGLAAFDYAENAGIVLMILLWPNLPDALVYSASLASVAKAALTTAAILSLLLSGALVFRRRRTSADQATASRHPASN